MDAVESAIRAGANAVPCQTKSCFRIDDDASMRRNSCAGSGRFLRYGSKVVLNSLTAGAGRWRHADLTRGRDRR